LSHDLPQVVLSDIRMPGRSGLEFLQLLRQRHPLIPVIIMTAYSDLESAVSAFQGGAFEYLPKPFDINHAVDLIRRALEQSRSKAAEVGQVEVAADILGHAPAMQDVFRGDRPSVSIPCDGAHQWRVGHRQRTGGARLAPA